MKRSQAMLGGAVLLFSAASALGDSLSMHCNKSACTRVRCDDWGENCSPVGYFRRVNGAYAVPQSKQVCDEFGDCHYALPSLPPAPRPKPSAPSPPPK